MKYLLDGYNILFFFLKEKSAFATQRQELVSYFREKFEILDILGELIFDGSHKRDEESGRVYRSPLTIIYTPKGQSADAYIIEKIEQTKNPKEITVVTLDGGLTRQAKGLQAHVQKPLSFIQFLQKKSEKPVAEKNFKETKRNIDILLKIFEDRFRNDSP